MGAPDTSDTPPLDPQPEIEAKYSYPPALAKACCDEFDYALRLATGEVWNFKRATPIDREWVTLDGIEVNPAWAPSISFPTPGWVGRKIIFYRGVDVRVSSIVWVAHAPFGS